MIPVYVDVNSPGAVPACRGEAVAMAAAESSRNDRHGFDFTTIRLDLFSTFRMPVASLATSGIPVTEKSPRRAIHTRNAIMPGGRIALSEALPGCSLPGAGDPNPGRGKRRQNPGKVILIVDDQPSNLKLLNAVLQIAGHTMLEAADQTCVKWLKS